MTAQLKVAASVTVDGKDASEKLKQLAGAVGATKQALVDAQGASKAAAAELKKVDQASAGAAAETARLREQLIAARTAEVLATAQHAAAAQALNQFSNSTNRATASAGAMRAASLNLGQQVGDIAQGIALGVPAMTLFAQQGGQVAFAMSGMGGAIGRVATFLSGPWGAALTGAALILTPFVAKLFESGRASTAAAEAMATQKAAAEQLAQAQRELDQVTGRTNKTIDESRRITLSAAQATLAAIQAKRQDIKVALEREILEKEQRQRLSPGFGGAAATQGAQARNLREIDALRQQAGQQEFLAAGARLELERITRQGALASAIESVRLKTDVVAKANSEYDRTIKALNGQVLTQAQYEEWVASATAKRDAAIKAAQESTRADARATKELAREMRDAAERARELALAKEKLFGPAGQQRFQDARSAMVAELSRQRGSADERSARPDDALTTSIFEIDKGLVAAGEKAGRRAGEAFNDTALVQAVAIGQAIGGAAGGALRTIAGIMQGAATGNFTGAGGPIAGLLTLAGGGGRRLTGRALADLYTPAQLRAADASGVPLTGNKVSDGFNQVFTQPLKKIGDGLQSFVGKLGGDFPKLIGKAAGGAATGTAVAGLANAVGIRMNQTGAQVGGALGGLLGPVGGLVGSVLGGVLGNLLGRTPRGSTTVSSSGGNITQSSAGDQAIQKATGAMGNSISNAISTIAEQLGGTIGDFAVSIGREGNRFRVDTAGRGRTKKNGRDVVGFAEDEAAALQFALADAIRDGAIKTSPRVQAALNRYADDVNKAVAEALKVRNLEDLLANRQNPFFSVFRDLELQIRQRNEVARQNGFDLAEIEKINGEQREAAVRDTLSRTTGSIRQLLNDLQFGSRATGSVAERLAGLTAERDRVAGLARAGDNGQLDTLASLVQQIDDLQREAFGSTGAFAASRSEQVSLLNDLVTQTEARIKAAADDARKATETTNSKLTEANTSLDELVAGQAQLIDLTRGLVSAIGGFAGTPTVFQLAPSYAR